MAENVTPVTLEVKDFEPREVMMIDYKFDQATDREGQIAGIPRGGRVTIRVKAMNDGNSQMLQWMLAPNDPRDFKVTFFNTVDGSTMKELKGTGCYCINYKEKWALRGNGDRVPEAREWPCRLRKSLEVKFQCQIINWFSPKAGSIDLPC